MANTTDKSILTAAGKALLAQLNAEEKPLIIDKMIFANVPNRPEFPQPDDVVPNDAIVHQEGVEQRGRLSADSVIYSTTLTSDVGPFEFNWTGAYCSEYGVLVTVDHHALTPKTADEPGVAGNTLVRSVVLEYKDIAEITNITVDASTWQYNATERLKKMDTDVAQAIIDQNGKDWFIEDGFLVTPQGIAFNIKAGAGYVSGNRVTLDFDRNVQVPNKPSFIYVDAYREGTPNGEQVTLFDFVVTAEEKDDYTDVNGVKHFVCKIAQVLADGSVSDLRPEGESADKAFVRNLASKQQNELTCSQIWPPVPERDAKLGDILSYTSSSVRVNGQVRVLDRSIPELSQIELINEAGNTIRAGGQQYRLRGVLDKSVVYAKGSELGLSIEDHFGRHVKLSAFITSDTVDAGPIINSLIQLSTARSIVVDDEFILNTQIVMRSRFLLDGRKHGKFKVLATLGVPAVLLSGCLDAGIKDLSFVGEKIKPVGGMQRFIQAEGCHRLTLSGIYGEFCQNQTITLDACTNSTIFDCHSANSYGVAFTIRNGCSGIALGSCTSKDAGHLSDEITGLSGRGILIWQSQRISVSDTSLTGSTEYNFRIYSEAGDTKETRDVKVTNLSLDGAGKIDFYIYNESGKIYDVNVKGLNVTTRGTGKTALALQGNNINVSNVILKSDVPQENTAIVFSNIELCKVSYADVTDFHLLAAFGSTHKPQKVRMSDIEATGLMECFGKVLGSGHRIKDSLFQFSEAANQTAIVNSSDGRLVMRNCEFDGAYRVIELNGDEELRDNRSINTKDISLRYYGSSIENMVLRDNSWDRGSNPVELAYIETNKNLPNSFIGYTDRDPSSFTLQFQPGSVFYNPANAVAGGWLGWILTHDAGWKKYGKIEE